MFYLSFGIFIGTSIMTFLACMFDKDLKEIDMPIKILITTVFGLLTGVFSAILELVINIFWK